MTSKLGLSLTAAVGAVFLGMGVLAFPSVSKADEGAIARGGLMYDKWYKVTGADTPKKAHPLYPPAGKYAQKADDNWRCKECHGWDYRGVNGAYASGSHKTGIKGIDGKAGTDSAAIMAILKGKDHGYGAVMDDKELMDLALFVSKGQLDTSKYIDKATKKPINANAARGKDIFDSVCARCHREDGTYPKDMDESLAAQMSNPWEVMHKIMNGHPGQNMPALRAFGPQSAVDVMGHILTLPAKKK